MIRQCALLVLLLLLGLLSPVGALADASGWRIEFLAAPELVCTDFDAARQRDDWQPSEVDAAALAASRALWMRLTPIGSGTPAAIAARNQVRSEWYDYRDPAAPRRSNVRIDPDSSAPGLLGLLLPEVGEWWAPGRPLYLCLRESLLSARAVHPAAITLLPAERFRAVQHRNLAGLALAIGVMLAMALLALAFHAGLRERLFLDYGLFVIGFAAYVLQITDTLGWLLPMAWREGPAPRLLGILAILLMLNFGLRFILSYTGMATAWPRLSRRSVQLAWVASAAQLLSAVGVLLGDAAALRRGGDFVFNISVGVIIVASTVAVAREAVRGRREARIYLLGWLPPLLLVLGVILRFLGLTPDSLRPSPILLAYAAALGSLVLGWGIAERAHHYRQTRDEALYVAEHDPLTGALNREAFGPLLAQAVTRRNACSLLYLDIDHFKSINDQHGHAVGDQVLRRLVERCHGELRGVDALARLGGEEFVALLTDTSAEEARGVAERIRLAIERDDAAVVPVTVSIGVAVQAEGESVEAWMQRADQALY
nr:GGDEF domain-containing protein [Xanthomonadales bacterium]